MFRDVSQAKDTNGERLLHQKMRPPKDSSRLDTFDRTMNEFDLGL